MASYFVDPSGSVNGGDGSLGSPWTRQTGSVVQWALTTGITVIASLGDQLNVQDSAIEQIDGPIDASAWEVGSSVGVTLRGYTSAENDGGQATIVVNGTSIIAATDTALAFHDINLQSGDTGAVQKLARMQWSP